jgi:hypothetical protein
MKAEDFLTKKGLDLDHFVIHDISGHYKAPIPLHKWLAEFAQQANKCTYASEQATGILSDELIQKKAHEKKTANDVSNGYLQAKRKYFIKGAKWARRFISENSNKCTCPPENTTGWTTEKMCNECGLITNKNNRFCDNCEKMVEPLSLGDVCPNCACDI